MIATRSDLTDPVGDGPVLLIGTRKGLWRLSADGDRGSWSLAGPAHLGHIIYHAVLDPRDRKTMLVAAATGHLGPTIFRSTDLGASFGEAAKPPAFEEGDRLERSVNHTFWLTPGHADEPGVWYGGTSPQALFKTEDGGETWSSVEGFNDHPKWQEWTRYPEDQTPNGALLHSMNVDPRDSSHLYVALSSGGVFESTDGGEDWQPLNSGSLALFYPDPDPEYGQDTHCLRLHPRDPDLLYQQSHCGIYTMRRSEAKWVRVGENMPAEVGDIGFPIELHPRKTSTAWVFPMDGTDVWPRTSPEGRPAVYMTRDAGNSWERQEEGLPEWGWLTVKRQAMTVDSDDPAGVYFGTTGGEVWGSTNEGESWSLLTSHLPEIYSVEVAETAG